jgi:23S rRNA (guanosine2251-2'-O)-methyltransferase
MDLICGINPVLEALAAGTRHFDRLLIVKGLRNQRVSEAIARASQQGIPLRFEARETLDRMAGGLSHQGIMAVVSAKPVIDVETLLNEARDPALIVLLDGVEDPRNLGAVLRTAEAAGTDGVLLPERHSAGLSETVSRASAGGLEHVKVARIGNVSQAIEMLKARGLWIVGFDAAGTERWDAVDYRRPVVLILGGEGRGMRRLVRERCDHLVSLPMFGQVGSLNVSVAAGIALYEVIRQRGAVPSHVRPIRSRTADTGGRVVGPAPDDGEQDPGHSRAPETSLAGEDADGPDDTGGPQDGGEPGPRIIRVHEEEAAWAAPPQILKAAPFRAHRSGSSGVGGPHGPQGRRGRRFKKGRGRPPGPPPGGAPAASAVPPPDGARPAEGSPPAKSGPARRRRHRRDRGDRPPGPMPGSESQGPSERTPQGPSGSPQGPPADPQGRPSAPPPGPRPHRRRGRRRRR